MDQAENLRKIMQQKEEQAKEAWHHGACFSISD